MDQTSTIRRTEIVRGVEKVTATFSEVVERAKTTINIYAESAALRLLFESDPYYKSLLSSRSRGLKIRYLTEITKENSKYSKRMIDELSIELRHVSGLRGNFLITENEFISTSSSIEEGVSVPELIYSNVPEIVRRNSYLFDNLWERAIPSDVRLRELERGDELGYTRVTFSNEEIFESASRFADEMKEEALIIAPMEGSLKRNSDFFQKLLNKARTGRVKVKILGRFSKDETELMREFLSSGIEIRSLVPGGIQNPAIGIYDEKHMGIVQNIYPYSKGSPEGQMYLSGVISTERQMISWVKDFFDLLWENSISGEDTLAEIEQGIKPPRLQIITEKSKIQTMMVDLIQKSMTSILLLLPSTNSLRRQEEIGALNAIAKASERGVKVNLLTPSDATVEKTLVSLTQLGKGMIDCRQIRTARTLTPAIVLIVDGGASLVVEVKEDSKPDFLSAVGGATYSVGNPTVLANVRFFERTWEAVELLEKEEKSRRNSELTQDILVHDIRNFNQITRSNLELLRERLTDEKLMRFINAALNSIDRSSELINKTRMLMGVLSGEDVSLSAVNLGESIERSLSLIGEVFRDRKIELSTTGFPDAKVRADSLLDQVFVNILSNAVKYTDSSAVPIQIQVEETEGIKENHSEEQQYWLVAIIDQGRGITDDMKKSVPIRYLGTATGKGLGLSIAHALVVNRYSGKIELKNRVEGDYSKGTRVEVWLPKA